MIDTHAHLDFPEFAQDLPQVLDRARDAGVSHIVTVGTCPDSNEKAIALAEEHEDISAAVGLHPNDCRNATPGQWADLAELAMHSKVVAVGETGLDFYRNRSPRDMQEEAFRQSIAIALDSGRPLIIHCRDAIDDCLRVLKDSGRERFKGVMHCFSGTGEEAQQFLSLGLYISFAGQITYPSAQDLRDAAKTVPLERTLLETDCPFLAPQSHRGKRNEPAYVTYAMNQLAEIHGVAPADVDRMTSVNAYRLFGVGKRPPRGNLAYTIRNSRYLNITNRCTNRCLFCSRRSDFYVKGYHLGLEAEPTLPQIVDAVGDMSHYDEIVFAGLGEPTLRLDVVTAIAKQAKRRGIRTRLSTNGQGCLINNRNICPELAEFIDGVSIGLTSLDPRTYQRLCRPEHPSAHQAAIKFVDEAKKTFPKVEVTSVRVPGVDADALEAWAAEKGVDMRWRTPGRPL